MNEARLYEFYQRQADFYMKSSNEVPVILPAYQGLDGGLHGHWGKHNQNNHSDVRWNDAEMGEVVTQVFRGGDMVVLKGICLRLGEKRELSACFDPLTLTYRSVWENGFVHFDGFRWGISRNAKLEGEAWFTTKTASISEGGKYMGFHRYGTRISTVVSILTVLETVSVSYSGLFPEISQSRFFRSSIPSPFWAEMGKISCFGKRAFMALRYISDSSRSILLATMSHWRSPSSSS